MWATADISFSHNYNNTATIPNVQLRTISGFGHMGGRPLAFFAAGIAPLLRTGRAKADGIA